MKSAPTPETDVPRPPSVVEGQEGGTEDEEEDHQDRKWLIGLTVLSSVCISGIIFGWAPLMLILRSDGTSTDVGESTLTATYTAGVMAQVACSPIAGWLLDAYGPRNTCAVGLFFVTIGLCLMADATQLTLPVGYALMGFGACLNYFASFATSYIYPQNQAAILSAINLCFDAGATMFYLFYVLYEVPTPETATDVAFPNNIFLP